MDIIRSATFEGMADDNGFPTRAYRVLYETLAKNKVKTIITGFMYISNEGRAMQPGQAGMDSRDKVPAFREITDTVHKNGSKIIAQIAHTGRQTTHTGFEIVGVSSKKSPYFNEKPRILNTGEIYEIVDQFAKSALYAKESGFDGVQIHCAHGYLIHQFLLSSINNRNDEFKDGFLFLEKIVRKINENCGEFPVWLKVSGGVDIEKYSEDQFTEFVKRLGCLRIAAIEVSYGTMDYALNIIRGRKIPVKTAFKHNPIYSNKNFFWKIFALPLVMAKIKKFTPMYNLKLARLAKANIDIPVIVVGGFRSGDEILNCGMDAVSLCRPFVREPDFLLKLENDKKYISRCINCNICAIMTDTKYPLRCYGGNND